MNEQNYDELVAANQAKGRHVDELSALLEEKAARVEELEAALRRIHETYEAAMDDRWAALDTFDAHYEAVKAGALLIACQQRTPEEVERA